MTQVITAAPRHGSSQAPPAGAVGQGVRFRALLLVEPGNRRRDGGRGSMVNASSRCARTSSRASAASAGSWLLLALLIQPTAFARVRRRA